MDDRGARKRAGEKVETTERSVGPSALAAAWPVSIYLVPASPVVSTLLSLLLLSLSLFISLSPVPFSSVDELKARTADFIFLPSCLYHRATCFRRNRVSGEEGADWLEPTNSSLSHVLWFKELVSDNSLHRLWQIYLYCLVELYMRKFIRNAATMLVVVRFDRILVN